VLATRPTAAVRHSGAEHAHRPSERLLSSLHRDPLIATEQKTRDIFGDYVSRYDFQQSVQDRATVPLYYENRAPELRLQNPNLDDQIYALIEEAELDEQAERRLERELGRQYQVITRDERLETVART